MQTKKPKLTHARHDTSTCLAPGLFRSLKKGERTKEKLDATYLSSSLTSPFSIRFWGPEPLGADDLRVLQGLIAMSGPLGNSLSSKPVTDAGRILREALELEGYATKLDAITVKGSYSALALEIGMTDGGSAIKSIRSCIERLWSVSIIVDKGDSQRQGFRLLSSYSSDNSNGFYVALSPLIAQAVMGGGKHTRILMSEVRALKSDASRLIHQRLCARIDESKTGKANIDTICAYVWPLPLTDFAMSTVRMQRKRARDALEELKTLGWLIDETSPGTYSITRPKPLKNGAYQ